MLYPVHHAWAGFDLTTFVVIGTDCTSSCNYNHYTITTAASLFQRRCTRYNIEHVLKRLKLVEPSLNLGLYYLRAGGASADARSNVNERCIKRQWTNSSFKTWSWTVTWFHFKELNWSNRWNPEKVLYYHS
jgi:hypothetical protein